MKHAGHELATKCVYVRITNDVAILIEINVHLFNVHIQSKLLQCMISSHSDVNHLF